MSKFSKRKLYITSGDYENFILEKKIRKDVDQSKIIIELDTVEEELFTLLIEFTKFSNIKTTVRVAGGWVRDKILAFIYNSSRKQNVSGASDDQQPKMFKKDIDIALDDISGKEFAVGFNNWLQTHHNYPVHSVGIINKDPDKSKHLETATLTWNEISIDFVGLRSETYTLESRIPIVSIGTAEEDAFRRDFTINSMFYNINERKIEDLTRLGIEDLYNKLIRTPLDPINTFLDDPLRALRAFRFTSRLHFRLEDGLINACKTRVLHDALQTKISRERIGSEVHEMISNKQTGNPAIGLRLIVNTDLVDSVFKMPENCVINSFINDSGYNSSSDFGDWYSQGPYLVELTHRVIDILSSDNSSGYIDNSLDSKKLGVIRKLLSTDHENNWGSSSYFSFLLPLFHHYFKNEKNKEVPLARYILSSSLKLPNKVTNSVMQLFDSLLRVIHRIVRMESLNELANTTLEKNPDRDRLKVDMYSEHFSNSIDNPLSPEIWVFYHKYFKCYLEEYCIHENNSSDEQLKDSNPHQLLQRKVELGIFVSYTGNLWLEMVVALFCLDLIYTKKSKTRNAVCWSDAEILDSFISHKYLQLIKDILEFNMATIYNFKNPIDGKVIHMHFPEIQKGPKYKFIINISLLWFMAFSQDPGIPNNTEITKCIEFIKRFKDTI
ncbi:tRNA adenylyltransferase Cca1p [Cryptosporidium canis]|uniref:tRNA adenylyltransferase Cca1p n=1 Tax=Cryptosporidium canis TaxID=195482 RepID=A0A9D5HXK1_9CRYT|nr:tRNA adenylyltransferase Cca1p [Cryptosporidium canis]